MKFIDVITKQEIDTNDYLESFVDEYSGEIKPETKVLNKNIRRKWFHSVFPQALIKKTVETTSLFDLVGDKLTDLLAGRSVEEIQQLQNVGKSAKAFVEVYIDGKLAAQACALRKASVNDDGTTWEYYTEAAQNAALDKCLIELEFVVPEETAKSPKVCEEHTEANAAKKVVPKDTSPKVVTTVTEAQKAIADIEALVESDKAVADDVPFDKSTPVEEILKHLNAADARAYVFTCNGKFKGKTVGEVYESDKDSSGFSKTLNWFANRFVGKDNILVASCIRVNNPKN